MASLRNSEIDRYMNIIDDEGFIISDVSSASSDDDYCVDNAIITEDVSEDDDLDEPTPPRTASQVDNASAIIHDVSVGLFGNNNLLPDIPQPLQWLDKPNTPKNILFYGPNVGVNIDNSQELKLEIEVFSHFAGNEFFELICKETNKYALMSFADQNRKKLKSDDNWEDCDPNEITAFFTLCIIMSVVKKPSLQSYWSTKEIIATKIFSKVMTLRRFQSIMRFLHFADNTECDPSDKLKKIRPIVTYFGNKFKANYTPDRNISIDESLMKFRGRLSYVQFNKSKRARFGIKFYKLCESASGYCSAFDIYTGKKLLPVGSLASEEIVMELITPYLDKGYICHLDNWYSSPSLYTRLLERNTYAIGTVRPNRKNMPVELKVSQLQKGEAERRSSDGILALKWMDKKQVHVLTTLHDDLNFQETGKFMRMTQKRPYQAILKPQAIVDYNNGMLAVDRHDQVLSYNPIMRRYLKGYRKIFFYMFDMCLFNAYVVFCKLNIKKKMHFSEFKTCLAEQLLETTEIRIKVSPGRKSANNPMRLQGRHFPMTIPPTENKQCPSKRCCVCLKNGLRKEVRVQCKQCLVPLHMDGCFERYHTVVHY